MTCLYKALSNVALQVLAAFLKAIGCIIPLMDATYAEYYTKEVMLVLVREFQTPDEEMKKIVLKVVKQCVETEGVQPDYVRREILPRVLPQLLGAPHVPQQAMVPYCRRGMAAVVSPLQLPKQAPAQHEQPGKPITM